MQDGVILLDDGTEEVAYKSGSFDGGDAMTVLFAILMGSFSLGQAAPNFEFFSRGRVAAYKVSLLLLSSGTIAASSSTAAISVIVAVVVIIINK